MELTTGTSISSPANYQHIHCIEEHGEISILLSRMLSKSECKILHAKNKVQAEYHLQSKVSNGKALFKPFTKSQLLDSLAALLNVDL